MELDLTTSLTRRRLKAWETLLEKTGLHPDRMPDETLLVWEDEELIATGSREGNILKYMAVDPMHQGEDLTATVVTQLRQSAFEQGIRHLFMYTKPANDFMFRSLFFYPIAITDNVLLMESKKDGIRDHIRELQRQAGLNSSADGPGCPGQAAALRNQDGAADAAVDGTDDAATGVTSAPRIGACVMNCNPFTLGHRYLVETAASQVDHLYIFVLSEDKSLFPAADRLKLVQEGTADLTNVTVLPSGPYLISSATFPSYFLKDRDTVPEVQCGLDIEVFVRYYAPAFGITDRFLGSEPLSHLTDQYNAALLKALPGRGIQVRIIPRKAYGSGPISATRVRELLGKGQPEELKELVPETTFRYLKEKGMI